jgi:hypothetical protein
MAITKLTNYDPRFGLSVGKFDGKWGVYFDLGNTTQVLERKPRQPCPHELGARYGDGTHVCLDCGANIAQDYIWPDKATSTE